MDEEECARGMASAANDRVLDALESGEMPTDEDLNRCDADVRREFGKAMAHKALSRMSWKG